jgi:3-mercaptopyruvate sulfurtransferase SseA
MMGANWQQQCWGLACALTLAGIALLPQAALADPAKYPEFAQQKLPDNVTAEFISIDELLADLKAGKKPVIVDVRSEEEFREEHISGALSAPIGKFTFHIKDMPKDRPLVLY